MARVHAVINRRAVRGWRKVLAATGAALTTWLVFAVLVTVLFGLIFLPLWLPWFMVHFIGLISG